MDAGPVAVDAGPVVVDAGEVADAGVVADDAGPEDAGNESNDAGPSDAEASMPDSGASSADSGVFTPDSGTDPDAGVADTGAIIPFEAISGPLPHRFAGANHHRIYQQHDVEPVDDVERNTAAQIEAMRRAGFRTLRTFLHQEDNVPWEIPPVTFTFEDPIGTYNDAELERIDRLMPYLVGDPDDPFDDIRLIVTFFNHLKGTSSGDVQEDLYLETFGEIGFYVDDDAREAFRNRISHVMNHRNPYLGNEAWKDLDIIVAWEPMNEPGIHTRSDQEQTTTATIAAWLTEMALHIKSIDQDGTLVLSGTAGHSGYNGGEDFGDNLPALIAAGGPNGIPGIDVYTIHYFGTDPRSRVIDARNVLPPGAQVWVTEFGTTRDAAVPSTYDPSEAGVLGRLEGLGVPWMFWRMGIRTNSNTWSRFEGDDDWSTMSDLARARLQAIESFDTTLTGTVSRNNGDLVPFELVDSSPRGHALRWQMTGGFQDLKYRFNAPIDLTGTAVTFRARTSANMIAEVQLKDQFGGFTSQVAVIELTPDWVYYQLPIADFEPAPAIDLSRVQEIVFFFKAGSENGETFDLDDLWQW